MRSVTMLFAAVAVLGCNNDPAALTPNQYFQQRADAVCSALEKACLLSVSTCTGARLAEYMNEYQTQVASFRDFIPSNAEACIAKVREVYGKLQGGMVAMPAADYQAMQSVCANVYRGVSPANGACQLTIDCLGDLICDKGFCGTARLVPPGEGCANIGEYCAPNTFCSPSPTTGRLMCMPKVSLQGDCTANPCMDSLRCLGGVCVARAGFGGACTTDGDCDSGLFCEPYAAKCAQDIRFADGTAACAAMSGP